ncbi:hypothetical protein [Deinococcus sonorensis]|uniref:Uncharacterized protein n=2 Tax=Deinococcus sonorensis TaxID=309891 RepID=A0AAU7U5U4_9DEIO
MFFQIESAPEPPEYSFTMTVDALAQRDARFARLSTLRARGILADVVQDSADLQNVHLRLGDGRAAWRGTPGQLNEDGSLRPRPFHGWSEDALSYGLGLDLGRPRVRVMPATDLLAALRSWPAGLVYAFHRRPGPAPALARRLNLSAFIDRLEVEFLASLPGRDLAAIRAHRLSADGQLDIWRSSLQEL